MSIDGGTPTSVEVEPGLVTLAYEDTLPAPVADMKYAALLRVLGYASTIHCVSSLKARRGLLLGYANGGLILEAPRRRQVFMPA